MRKGLWIVALFSVASAAQAAPFTLAPLKGHKALPSVTGDNTVAARRITEYAYMASYRALLPTAENPSPPVPEVGERTEGDEVGFEVLANNGRLLSLTLTFEGCGAYCEIYSRNFTFDAASGRRVWPNDLFTGKGMKAIAGILLKQRTAQIQAAIRENESGAKEARKRAGKGDDELAEGLEQMNEMFRSCDALNEPEVANSDYGVAADGSIVFRTGRCSNHAMRALDNLYEFENRFTPSALAAHMTPYGKAVLLGQGKVNLPPSPRNQALRGHVGKSAITFFLDEPYPGAGYAEAVYFYDKHGSAIPLTPVDETASFSNIETGRSYLFSESAGGDDTAKAKATIRIETNQGARLKGTWSGNGKELEFEVGP